MTNFQEKESTWIERKTHIKALWDVKNCKKKNRKSRLTQFISHCIRCFLSLTTHKITLPLLPIQNWSQRTKPPNWFRTSLLEYCVAKDKSIVLDSIFLSPCLILLCMPIHIRYIHIFICSSCSYMRCASVKRRFRHAIFVTKFSSLISSDCKHTNSHQVIFFIYLTFTSVDMGALSLLAPIHFIYSWLFYVNRMFCGICFWCSLLLASFLL